MPPRAIFFLAQSRAQAAHNIKQITESQSNVTHALPPVWGPARSKSAEVGWFYSAAPWPAGWWTWGRFPAPGIWSRHAWPGPTAAARSETEPHYWWRPDPRKADPPRLGFDTCTATEVPRCVWQMACCCCGPGNKSNKSDPRVSAEQFSPLGPWSSFSEFSFSCCCWCPPSFHLLERSVVLLAAAPGHLLSLMLVCFSLL